MDSSIPKLKVTLIRGPIVFKDGALNNEATPALAFAYLSAYLSNKGYSVTVIDAIGAGLNKTWAYPGRKGFNCQGLSFQEIIERIPRETDVIGFSGMFSGEWPVLRDLIERVRAEFPQTLFVAGGEHISALAEYSLRDCPALDICVRGEGEHTFYEILECHRKSESFDNISGVAYLNKDKSYISPVGPPPRIKNIDNIPWPDWSQCHLEKFWEVRKCNGIITGRDMPMMFSRGCPYRCTFCSNPNMYTTRYILRDVSDVIKEIEHYIHQYQITGIQVYDLTAIIKKDWIIEFCTQLIEKGIHIKWQLPSGTRSEALDEETLHLMKKTGCHYLVYAPESGSPETLQRIKKKVKLPRLTRSIRQAKKEGIILRANLIVGFPGESWKNIFETFAYGLKLSFMGVEEVSPNIFSPYPGTEIFNRLIQDKQLTINDNYFYGLTSLNSAYFSTQTAIFHNSKIKIWKLGILRTFYSLTTYFFSYFLYPYRILRAIKSFSNQTSSTVFEQRIKDYLKRKFHKELKTTATTSQVESL